LCWNSIGAVLNFEIIGPLLRCSFFTRRHHRRSIIGLVLEFDWRCSLCRNYQSEGKGEHITSISEAKKPATKFSRHTSNYQTAKHDLPFLFCFSFSSFSLSYALLSLTQHLNFR
jgi:hypothetical protein